MRQSVNEEKFISALSALDRFNRSKESEDNYTVGSVSDCQDLSAAIWQIRETICHQPLTADQLEEMTVALARARLEFRDRYNNLLNPAGVSEAFSELRSILKTNKPSNGMHRAAEWLQVKLRSIYKDAEMDSRFAQTGTYLK